MTEAPAQGTLIAFMEARGYDTLHRSAGYSNHLHPRRERGRVDFMYVRGETADRLFDATAALPGPGGRMIPVPKPEHLIAMKVQAMTDAPERMWQDLVDIAWLLRVDGVNREEATATSCGPGPASRRNGVSSPTASDSNALDLARDVPTSAADVVVLRRLRSETPSWLSLSAAEFDALVPEGALRRKPVIRADARPFTL